jgi:hypothetical protein
MRNQRSVAVHGSQLVGTVLTEAKDVQLVEQLAKGAPDLERERERDPVVFVEGPGPWLSFII